MELVDLKPGRSVDPLGDPSALGLDGFLHLFVMWPPNIPLQTDITSLQFNDTLVGQEQYTARNQIQRWNSQRGVPSRPVKSPSSPPTPQLSVHGSPDTTIALTLGLGRLTIFGGVKVGTGGVGTAVEWMCGTWGRKRLEENQKIWLDSREVLQ